MSTKDEDALCFLIKKNVLSVLLAYPNLHSPFVCIMAVSMLIGWKTSIAF